MEPLHSFFRDKKVGQVLDVGCGSGDFIKVLNGIFPPETQITGIDPSQEALLEALEKFPFENISFCQMEGEMIDYPDNYFDVVSISFALHHLADVKKTLSEMKRVVKPEGWLIINEVVSDIFNEAQENHKMQHRLKSVSDQLNGIIHREVYSETEVLEIVRQNNVRIETTFSNLKMKEPSFDPQLLEERLKLTNMAVDKLKGHPVYEQMKQEFAQFNERLQKFGFQISPSVVVIGQKS